MKFNKLILAALAAAAITSTANAQEVINITGATAFRQAVHAAIIASVSNLNYGYQSTNVGNAGRAIFTGDIDVDGTPTDVVIRTSWSGSVAGGRAVINQTNSVSYYDDAIAGLTPGGTANLSTAGANSESTLVNRIAFMDNTQSNTPFDAVDLLGGPVGVIAFVPVVNETAAVDEGQNITTAMLERLQASGNAPLQFITGNASHSGKRVYWTGRNTLSGTRAIYLSDSGVGASKPVQQYRSEPANNSSTVPTTALQIWPTSDGLNTSDVWASDFGASNTTTAGNGGYNSGGDAAAVLQRAFDTSVTIKDATGATLSTRAGADTILMSVISAQEGQDIQTGLGKVLAYNGSYINPEALPTGLSATDKDKIIKGQYTLWSYENLYYRDDVTDPEFAFITLLQTNVPTNIAGNGIQLSEMRVSRTQDGGSLTVLGSLL